MEKTEKIIKVEELNDYGFDCGNEVGTVLITDIDKILDYFSADQDAIEEIESLQELGNDVVLEIVVDIDENGIATSFSYGFGKSPETVTACNEDDLMGVIEWLRSGII